MKSKATMADEKVEMIEIESIVAARNGRPYVVLKWKENRAQLSPYEARQHAYAILGAADAAESDGFVVSWLTAKMDIKPEHAVAVLQDFRKYREEQEKKGKQ
jgi:hypothetical protein